MAGEIQLNSTSFASESGGTITINNATVGSAVAMSANQACVKTAINASGSAPIYACRAWINFDGTSASIGTGRASGNVSSVTDNGGNGDYTINFATAMPDVNYSVAGAVNQDETSAILNFALQQTQAVGSVRVATHATGGFTRYDAEIVCVSIFR